MDHRLLDSNANVLFFFFFLGFFWTWIIFKALIEFATKLFWFYVLAL